MLVDELLTIWHIVPHRNGVLFTADDGADPVGYNRRADRFCSKVYSILYHDVYLYHNPNFNIICRELESFLDCYGRAIAGTSGTFMPPVWANRPI